LKRNLTVSGAANAPDQIVDPPLTAQKSAAEVGLSLAAFWRAVAAAAAGVPVAKSSQMVPVGTPRCSSTASDVARRGEGGTSHVVPTLIRERFMDARVLSSRSRPPQSKLALHRASDNSDIPGCSPHCPPACRRSSMRQCRSSAGSDGRRSADNAPDAVETAPRSGVAMSKTLGSPVPGRGPGQPYCRCCRAISRPLLARSARVSGTGDI